MSNSTINLNAILSVAKVIYGFIRPWLSEEAKKSTTPVDDWMIEVLDKILA